jgi:hypothetical protein
MSVPETFSSCGGWTGCAALAHLIETVRDLRERGVHFRSLQEQLDTTTSGGKLVFQVFGALRSLGPYQRPDDGWPGRCAHPGWEGRPTGG